MKSLGSSLHVECLEHGGGVGNEVEPQHSGVGNEVVIKHSCVGNEVVVKHSGVEDPAAEAVADQAVSRLASEEKVDADEGGTERSRRSLLLAAVSWHWSRRLSGPAGPRLVYNFTPPIVGVMPAGVFPLSVNVEGEHNHDEGKHDEGVDGSASIAFSSLPTRHNFDGNGSEASEDGSGGRSASCQRRLPLLSHQSLRRSFLGGRSS